jgi:hypothetical protein
VGKEQRNGRTGMREIFEVTQRAEKGMTMRRANKRDGNAVKVKGRRYTSKKGRNKLFHL